LAIQEGRAVAVGGDAGTVAGPATDSDVAAAVGAAPGAGVG